MHFLSLGQYEQLLTFSNETGTPVHQYFEFVAQQEKAQATKCMIHEQYIDAYVKTVGDNAGLPNGAPTTIALFDSVFESNLEAQRKNEQYWKNLFRNNQNKIQAYLKAHNEFEYWLYN